jgi:hypothetical protein
MERDNLRSFTIKVTTYQPSPYGIYNHLPGGSEYDPKMTDAQRDAITKYKCFRAKLANGYRLGDVDK